MSILTTQQTKNNVHSACCFSSGRCGPQGSKCLTRNNRAMSPGRSWVALLCEPSFGMCMCVRVCARLVAAIHNEQPQRRIWSALKIHVRWSDCSEWIHLFVCTQAKWVSRCSFVELSGWYSANLCWLQHCVVTTLRRFYYFPRECLEYLLSPFAFSQTQIFANTCIPHLF